MSEGKLIKSTLFTLIIVSFFSYAQVKYKSIHQLQLNQFKNVVPVPLKSEEYYKNIKNKSTPRVKKQVLGYYTYWKTGTSNIQWDLLTILAYFSAEINTSGDITNLHGWPSSAPINEAHSHGVKVILTATLFGSSSIRTLIQSETNRQNCIQNLFNQVQSAGADGICIDFELPYSSDREYFNTFIQELSDYFHTNMPGSLVVVDTPAVNWNDRMDFDTLTDYADYLFIMGYDYHYSGGDPGPVAPLSYTSGSPWPTWASIVQTLDDYINGTYGVGNSKKSKLILGVPYYGYDWPAKECEIPTEKRDNGSAVIYSTAVDKAAQYNREWDDYSQTPYYDYNCSTSYPHQAWYDDDISIGLKYDKVNEYNIGGTGMWALNYDGTRTELWQKLREKFGFYYITATAYGGGSIDPQGKIQVDYGKSITFNFYPDSGSYIARIVVDGNNIPVSDSYTFTNVNSDHTIDVYFEKKPTYTITATAEAGGTIEPSGEISVEEGNDITFTITPDNGYQIEKVEVDGNNIGVVNKYTFENVNANHTIKAYFKEQTVSYVIYATAHQGGIISPSGKVSVNEGENITFSIKPDQGYQIDRVEVDGQNMGAITSYTFEFVKSDHTIDAYFKESTTNTYSITASADNGGKIEPSGTIVVNEGESQTFIITPDNGYKIKDVQVDGNSIGIVNTYTFSDVQANHTIHATFSQISNNTYIITASCGEGGSIYPSGEIKVNEGDSIEFAITPDNGFTIEKVMVDGYYVGRQSSYRFKNITANHTISAYFTKISAPEIEYFTASTQSGLVMLEVEFNCKFKDPQNRQITKYIWVVSGDENVQFETDEPQVTLDFYASGTYFIKVQAENDLGFRGESGVIRITPVEIKQYPLSINGQYSLNGRNINFKTYLINPFNITVNMSIKKIDLNGNTTTKNINLSPYTKTNLSELFNKDSEDIPFQYKIFPNSFLLIFTEMNGENLGTAAYQGLTQDTYLKIPHIAEETDYWDTLASIGNSNGKNLIIEINNNGYSLEAKYSNLINLNKFATQTKEQSCWATIYDINQSQVLNGYEAFIQKGKDGAAITLYSQGNNKFFIPHIPEEKEIFWTGFTFTNTENRKGQIVFYLYNDEHKLTGIKYMEIGANSKIKGLFSQLFSEQELKQSVWGYAYSSVKVSGIEIYGVSGGAICGYPLPPKAKESGILPIALSNENLWTGIVALNPNSENAYITFNLFDGKGNKIETKEVKIAPFTRFKTLLRDLFTECEFTKHSFIEYTSNKSIVCIEVEGDKDRTYMRAINAY